MNINTKAKGNALLLLTAFIWGIAFGPRVRHDYGALAFSFCQKRPGRVVLIPCIFLMDHLTPGGGAEKKRQMPKRPLLIGGVLWLRAVSGQQPAAVRHTVYNVESRIYHGAVYHHRASFCGFFTGHPAEAVDQRGTGRGGHVFSCITEGFSIKVPGIFWSCCVQWPLPATFSSLTISPQDGVRMSCIQRFLCARRWRGEHAAGGAGVFFGDDPAWLPIVYAGVLFQRWCRVYAADPGPEGHRPGGGVSSDEYGIGVCHAGGLGAAGAGAVAPGDVGLRAGFCRDHPEQL